MTQQLQNKKTKRSTCFINNLRAESMQNQIIFKNGL